MNSSKLSFCCICYRSQSKYSAPCQFYEQNRNICKKCDIFIRCNYCQEGLYCFVCIQQLGTQCAVCRQNTFAPQQNDEPDYDDLDDLAAETTDTVSFNIGMINTTPTIEVAFIDFLNQRYNNSFMYEVSFSITASIYQLLQDSNQMSIFEEATRNGLTFVAGFDNDRLLDTFGDEDGFIPFGEALVGFFAFELETTLIDLINDNSYHPDYIQSHLSNGGIIQAPLDEFYKYCDIPFRQHIDTALYAKVTQIGLDRFQLHIHLGQLEGEQVQLSYEEVDNFNKPDNGSDSDNNDSDAF